MSVALTPSRPRSTPHLQLVDAVAAVSGELDRERVVSDLREQLALLAQHYASDVTLLEERLKARRRELAREEARAVQAEERARRVEREIEDLLLSTARQVAELHAERWRADLLEEALGLPIWAISRRRALVRLAASLG